MQVSPAENTIAKCLQLEHCRAHPWMGSGELHPCGSHQQSQHRRGRSDLFRSTLEICFYRVQPRKRWPVLCTVGLTVGASKMEVVQLPRLCTPQLEGYPGAVQCHGQGMKCGAIKSLWCLLRSSACIEKGRWTKKFRFCLGKDLFFSTTDSPTSLYIFLLQLSLSLCKFEGKRGEVVRYPDSKHRFWD